MQITNNIAHNRMYGTTKSIGANNAKKLQTIHSFEGFVSSAKNDVSEQEIAYNEIKFVYNSRYLSKPTVKSSTDKLEDFTTSDMYEKMYDSLTGVTYYKSKTLPEIKMTGDEAEKFRNYFGSDIGKQAVHHMSMSGKMKDNDNFRIVISDSNPASGLFNDYVFIEDKSDGSCLVYENIGDPNKFFEELDKYLFKNSYSMNINSFKGFMDQYNNGNTKLNFSYTPAK